MLERISDVNGLRGSTKILKGESGFRTEMVMDSVGHDEDAEAFK